MKAKQIAPEQAARDHVRAYLVELASSGRVSAAYCRGARAAIILLYETTLRQRDKVGDLPRMKRPSQLPVVLSRDEVAKILKVTSFIKHKALLVTAYSAGLRVGEVVRLKVSEIDSKRMQIRVTAGKGTKDRYTLLSETTLEFCATIFARSSRRIGCSRARSAMIICQSGMPKKFLRKRASGQASSSPLRSIHCAIRLRRICWKTG